MVKSADIQHVRISVLLNINCITTLQHHVQILRLILTSWSLQTSLSLYILQCNFSTLTLLNVPFKIQFSMILVIGSSSWALWENKAKNITGKVISKIQMLVYSRSTGQTLKNLSFLGSWTRHFWIAVGDWVASDNSGPTLL